MNKTEKNDMFPRMYGLVFLLAAALPTHADVYVATSGNDANPGTRAKPVRSLEKARDIARQQRSDSQSQQTTIVWIAGGESVEDSLQLPLDKLGGFTGDCPALHLEPASIGIGRPTDPAVDR